jgi:hypothetical protein
LSNTLLHTYTENFIQFLTKQLKSCIFTYTREEETYMKQYPAPHEYRRIVEELIKASETIARAHTVEVQKRKRLEREKQGLIALVNALNPIPGQPQGGRLELTTSVFREGESIDCDVYEDLQTERIIIRFFPRTQFSTDGHFRMPWEVS